MKPMSEIAKCQCGAEATLNSPCVRGEAPFTHFVDCERCGSSGPNEDSPAEAIAAWNSLMRPRPTATKGSGRVCLGSTSIRIGFVGDDGDDDWIAQCTIDGWHVHCYSEDDAMAELVEHLRGLGFDVKEVSGG